MKRLTSVACSLVALALVIVLAGCGGGGYSVTPPPPVINVSVSPNFGAIDQGQSVTFTATTNDPAGKGVTWSLSGQGMLTGSTSSATTYKAPSTVSSVQQVTLTATSVTNPADSFPLGFNVDPPPTITPGPLPDGNVGTPYGQQILTTGGTGNFTFALTSGALPPGLPPLTLSPGGFVSGTPVFPVQKYDFTVTLTDMSPGGNVVTPPAQLSINILKPLQLTITTPTAPAGAVGFPYLFSISATGGVQPYTFNLTASSSALPAGLGPLTTVSNQGVISGTPTTAGTTSNILVQAMDTEPVPMTSMPPTNYSITINPSTSFVGTQAPGDIWQILLSHNDATDGVFDERDQGTSGLPGTTTFNRTKFFSATTPGFRQYLAHTGRCRGIFCQQIPAYAVEMPEEMLLLQPDGMGSKVVAAVANSCPQLPATTNYQFVTLPSSKFSIMDPAYGNVAVTQPSMSSNTYNLTRNTFQLDTTPSTVNEMHLGVLCDSTFQVLSFAGSSSNQVTMAFSVNGAMVIDNGTGIPAVGLQQPAMPLPTTGMNGILAGQYLGVLFTPNAPAGSLVNPGHISQMVGFGPNTTGTTLTGGIFVSPGTDPFANHLTDHVITLGTQAPTSPGLFTGGTLAVGSNPGITIKNFDVVAGMVNGKFVLYGIGLDSSNSSSPQPTAVLLIQQ